MTQWLAGMRITAARLNDHSIEATANSGASAPAGFTLIGFTGTKINGLAMINFASSRAGVSPADDLHADVNGNLNDITIGTLPLGWRPLEMSYASVGDGFGDGECSISTSGVISVRSWSNDGGTGVRGIVVGRNMRVTATFISANT